MSKLRKHFLDEFEVENIVLHAFRLVCTISLLQIHMLAGSSQTQRCNQKCIRPIVTSWHDL